MVKACLNLDKFTVFIEVVASASRNLWYVPLKCVSPGHSSVHYPLSVARANDKMFASEGGLNQTWKPLNCAFWYVPRCPPDEYNFKHSPSVTGTISVTNFSLQKI